MIYTTTLFALCLITETAFAAQENAPAAAACEASDGFSPEHSLASQEEKAAPQEDSEEKMQHRGPRSRPSSEVLRQLKHDIDSELSSEGVACEITATVLTAKERRWNDENAYNGNPNGYQENLMGNWEPTAQQSLKNRMRDEARLILNAINSYKEDFVTLETYNLLKDRQDIDLEKLDLLLAMNQQVLPENLPRVRIRNAPDQRLNGIYRPVLAEPIGDSKGDVTVVRYEISCDSDDEASCSIRWVQNRARPSFFRSLEPYWTSRHLLLRSTTNATQP